MFKLVKPELCYKKSAILYIEELLSYNSAIHGTGFLDRYLESSGYEEWLDEIRYLEFNSDSFKVSASTFFMVDDNDFIIGMVNIRHTLNDKLLFHGGNIGYSIRPLERKNGYNKVNLYLGLLCCQEHGIKEVLLDCDKDNLGSARTIKSLGGILKNEFYDDKYGVIIQQYVIDVDSSIRNNRNKYDKFLDN